MVTPELIEYIRQQLAAGHKKEGLRTLLIANGWQEADINEAYSQIASGPKPASKTKLPDSTVKLIGLLLVVLIGAGIYWYTSLRVVPVADDSTDQTTQAIATPQPSPTAMAPISLAKDLPTIIGETGLQATYLSQADSSYTVKVENPQNTVCAAQELSITTTASYICGSQSYEFTVQSAQSSADAVTVLVAVTSVQ